MRRGKGTKERRMRGRDGDEDEDETSEEGPEAKVSVHHVFCFQGTYKIYSRVPYRYPNFGPLQRCHGLYEYHVRCQLDRVPLPAF